MVPEEGTSAPVIDTAPPPVGAPAAQEVAAAEPDWDTAVDADLQAIFKKNNPDREDDGKFAAKTPATDTTGELPDQAPVEKVEQPQAAINAPQSWSADMKTAFATLPPAVQEFVSRRETEASEKISQQGRELATFEPIRSVVEQNMDVFERNGVSVDDGIARLINAERLLESNPVAAIAQLAQAYGVDLRQFNGQPGQPQQPQDTATQALHQRIAQLEGALNQTSSRIEQREAAEAEERKQSTLTLIEKFAQDKTDWADLEDDIHAEIIGIRAAIDQRLRPAMPEGEILKAAYERAQRNNPDAWAKKQAADKQAEEKKRIEAAKKNAEDAARSKKANVASSPANGHTVSTMDETLRETYRRINSG